jgi:N-acetylmuramoyl-L-alanine amidase
MIKLHFMRAFWITLLLFTPSRSTFSAAQQQLIPIIHQTQASPTPTFSEWKTFLRVAEYGGVSYVSLVQVSELLNGHLRWHTVSKNVDLSMYGHTIRFPYYASSVQINGRRVRLEQPTVKNEDGFWVPISFFASDAFFRVTHTKLEWPPPPERQGTSDEGREKFSSNPSSPIPRPSALVPVPSAVHAIKRIVIDPGHGGKDPGAVGPNGTQEKNVNLRLAQELADALRETYGYEVLLTRMDDTFIPLEERAQLANKHNADLFISLHCNASKSPKRKGFEVYFLSERASDSHADAVARLENAVLAYEGKEVPSPNRVKEVLRSLVKTANINEASALGSLLDRHLAERLYEPSLGVKQAAFYVLRGAEMPAVLIETGFISNTHEEQLLQDNGFRQKLIEAIAAGIVAYDERKAKEHR